MTKVQGFALSIVFWSQYYPTSIYLSFIVEVATGFCFSLDCETNTYPKNRQVIIVFFLSITSESEQLV